MQWTTVLLHSSPQTNRGQALSLWPSTFCSLAAFFFVNVEIDECIYDLQICTSNQVQPQHAPAMDLASFPRKNS